MGCGALVSGMRAAAAEEAADMLPEAVQNVEPTSSEIEKETTQCPLSSSWESMPPEDVAWLDKKYGPDWRRLL